MSAARRDDERLFRWGCLLWGAVLALMVVALALLLLLPRVLGRG